MVLMVQMEHQEDLVIPEKMDLLEKKEAKETLVFEAFLVLKVLKALLVIQVLQVLLVQRVLGLYTHDGEGSLAPISQEHNLSIMEELEAIIGAYQMTLSTPPFELMYNIGHMCMEWDTKAHFQVVSIITMCHVLFAMFQQELQC